MAAKRAKNFWATLSTQAGGLLDEFHADALDDIRTHIRDEWLPDLDADDIIRVYGNEE